ncbi:acyl-CoA dehydrogenase [Dactylosporangium roseum]|uniref:Acyl-[acyl-carrier-protein] dehydrogenase MbtN n=1 Tax=Dactylosporangium roseum TaxID=47989 RepID=A0ABY5ZBT0_9ACTN|nr:acyl-CoA dehydrogenase [Dactylosporangium roseum]UWZ39580.1 acyl-CoA dehydrogenase [Dactylosporangium roseum]
MAEPTPARAVWAKLGRSGAISGLYPDGRPAPDPARLGALLAALDGRHPLGVVLAVCVQAATALPLLREHRGDGPIAAARRSAERGESMLALAVTDAGASGSDLMAATTTARISGDEVVLDGVKSWITNARTADHAVVLARHRPQPHFTSFVLVLVPTALPGVKAESAGGDLFAGAGVGHLHLDGVTVGRDHVIGSPGRGLPLFARHVATERLAGAQWATAIARRVLADTHRRLVARGLWANDAVRARLAWALVDLRRIEATAAAHDAGGRDALLSSMLLKAATAQSLERVLGECVQLQGADAFGDGGPARLRTEAAMFGIAGGASGAMLAGIADHAADLLGGPR